jgi:ABC-type bacteriocin/lantibiotic exporter with double-glycine peptidase domain
MPSKPPFYKQETPYSCVPACIRMVLASFGRELSEAALCVLCDCTSFGTEALNAVDAVRQLSFAGTGKHTLSIDELTAQVRQGLYPIVFVNTLPIDGITGGHALVVVGIDQTAVAVYDPLHGERHLPRATFESAWAMMHNLTLLIQQ